MSASRSLGIVFVRDINNSKKDDVITINPHKSSARMFQVEYRDSQNKLRNDNVCTEEEVFDFVDNMFNLLTIDEDPFNYVQLTAPMFPTILLKTYRLSDYPIRESVMSVVKNTVRNWPSAEEIVTAVRPVTRSVTRNLA